MVAANYQPEVTLNRLLRRADWHFLLPDPRPARSICFAQGLLAQAVAAISDQMIEPATEPAADCDLAVARNPSGQMLPAAWAALRPGGACYLEWSSPLAGGPAKVRRQLEALGFTQVACYWPWPWPGRAAPLYWLSLDSPQVVQYFLANRKRGPTPLSQAWNKWLEVVWRLGLRLQLLAPLSVIARKPPAARVALLDRLRAGWSQWSSDPPPPDLDWMLLTGGAKTINKVVGLVFAGSECSPRLIVKLARVPEAAAALEREATNLQTVQALRPQPLCGVPRVLFSQQWAGQTVLGETALTGRPLYTLLRRANCRDLALKVTEWLAALGDRATPCARSEWWNRLIETTVGEFERNFGPVIDPEQLQATRAILATLGDLPLVCEQRDCSPWNVLIADDGALVILDWESAEPCGLPALDLIYFLTYLVFFLDGAMESRRFTESYRAALDPATFTGRVVAECQQHYWTCLGLEPAMLRPLRLLTWLIHSRSDYRRLVAESAGQPNPADLRRGLFIRLWEEEYLMLSPIVRLKGWLVGPSGWTPSKRQQFCRRLIHPVRLGTLRRTTPLSKHWGYDRGTPVDRYFIERFLDEHRADIRGHILEVKNSGYTQRFGSSIERSAVLDIDPANPHATIVADLALADAIPADTFDCFILTQTLQYIYHLPAAIAQACRILRPGGVLLVTVPGISRLDLHAEETDYWRFTKNSCAALFGEVFGREQINVCAHGNVLTAIAFLTGLAYEELSPRELDDPDRAYPVVITVRAVKPGGKVAQS